MIRAARWGLAAGACALFWHVTQPERACVPLDGHPGAVVCGGRVERAVALAAPKPKPTIEVIVADRLPTERIPPWMPRACREHWSLFEQAGSTHGISPTLLSIVSLIESGCGGAKRQFGGVIVSSAGAAGIMQIIPATAQGIAANRGLVLPDDWRTNDALQIDYGAWLLAGHMRAYGRSAAVDPDYVETIRLSCIAYNGGAGAVKAYQRGQGYQESKAHSGLAVGMWQERAAKRSPTFELWRDAGGWRWMD